jgi:hypothetical protein
MCEQHIWYRILAFHLALALILCYDSFIILEERRVDMNKPVWFLDIDGVINGWKKHPRIFDSWNHVPLVANVQKTWDTPEPTEHTFDIYYSPLVIDFINTMSEKVDIVWLTSWEQQAATVFAPGVGITSTFPVGFELAGIEVPGGKSFLPYKHKAGGRLMHGMPFSNDPGMFAGRPVIWTDDELDKTFRKQFVNSLDSPALLIKTFASTGLTHTDLDRISTFVKDSSS